MPAVSILIPAYKAEYLGRAILSAQQQTFEDIEILVGDDTPDGLLREIVERFDDPRVRYFHHGFQKGTRNSRALWEKASGQFVKWLFDDDLLMPTSVETLVNALRANPGVVLAFHERVIIDGSDAVIARPEPLLPAGEAALISRPSLVDNMLGRINNFVGEPSNIMLVRDRVDISRAFDYRTWVLDFLGDVALYLNCAEQAPLLAVGGYLSAFRQHAGQASVPQGSNFAAGLYEWELMVRGEAAAGYLTGPALQSAERTLRQLYAHWAQSMPEIARLLANLDELTRVPAHQLYASERFLADLGNARSVVAERIAQRKRAAPAPSQKFCVVCEQPVAKWLAHPEANKTDRAFMKQVESIGSTLEHHQCPNCGCNDRERHLWLYLAFSRILEDVSQKRVLHIAPEPGIEQRIRRLSPGEYVGGDLSPRLPHHRRLNVEHLDFPDGYFDIIICNHVLEHVGDPDAALAEFNRCLAPGGHLIAQTPYSPLLRNTFELNKPVTPAFATHYFGQSDHVRLFGADIVDRFRSAGLAGDLYAHDSVLGQVDPETYGCNGREPFFFFTKGAQAPQFGV
ncbi:MAG TPA: methyltransferase domain-containing protein [Trinickia sp.]|uniref:glycosyltransferase n=1 Tax=Trinickia sp. TaxID=2571163 RepID=UPI002CDCFE15|nr:methyltransferase domain-containing protein [Trinickia sp.]HVW53248.1 methyltransferase domain-containing protein [Trinickia sp.]